MFNSGFGEHSPYSGYPDDDNNKAWEDLYNCQSGNAILLGIHIIYDMLNVGRWHRESPSVKSRQTCQPHHASSDRSELLCRWNRRFPLATLSGKQIIFPSTFRSDTMLIIIFRIIYAKSCGVWIWAWMPMTRNKRRNFTLTWTIASIRFAKA